MVGFVSSLALVALGSIEVFAASVPPASSYAISNIYNCSGNAPTPPVQGKDFFPTYGPQIQGNKGWETWTYVLPGVTNDSMSVLQWTRGDPASPSSNPEDLATFSIFASHGSFSATVKEIFVYKELSANILDISIGENHLIFDGTIGQYGGWNISINIEGLKLDIFTDPVPPELEFVPTYDGVTPELVPGYSTNLPLTRGHTDGLMTYPSGEMWLVHEVTSLKHTYSKKPIQELVSSYTRGTSFVELAHVHWFEAQSISSQKSEAAQLVVGSLTELDFPLKYEVSNDPSALEISTNQLNTTITFPGCDTTENNIYKLSPYPISYRGAFVDCAGGKTEYYSTITDASIWTDAGLYVGNDSLGLIEIYTSPKH